MTDFRDIAATTLKNNPEKAALILDDLEISYADFDHRIQQHAEAFASLGIQKGDRIGLLSHNRPMLASLMFACWRVGAVALPINHRYRGPEVEYALEHSGTRMLIAQDVLAKPLAGTLNQPKSVEYMFTFDTPIAGIGEPWRPYSLQEHDSITPVEAKSSDPSAIYYTSGSTSKPKGVTHTRESIYATAVSRTNTLGFQPDDRWLLSTQLVHVSASLGSFLPCIYAGGTTVFLEEFTAESYLAAMAKCRPTRSIMLPALLHDILDHPDSKNTDFSCLRSMECGGDVVTQDLYDQWAELSDAPLAQLLGMTECEGYCLANQTGSIKVGSAGKPREGVEVQVVDEDGKTVPPGVIGELTLRSKSMMVGYWNDEENTAKTIRDGWLHSGDQGKIDEDGDVWFVGRSKEIIIHRGSNIAPGEVESILDTHPDISEGVVVGVNAPKIGQKVVAFLEPRHGATIDTAGLRAWMMPMISEYKIPEEWVIVEKLPRNAVGKMDRKKIHELANEQFGTDATAKA